MAGMCPLAYALLGIASVAAPSEWAAPAPVFVPREAAPAALRIGPRVETATRSAALHAGGTNAAAGDDGLAPARASGSLPVPHVHRGGAGAVDLGAFMRVQYEHTTGDPLGRDARGGVLEDVLFFAHGRLGDTQIYVESDFASGEVVLEEAWGEVSLDGRHWVRIGRVQRQFLASQAWTDDAVPFLARSYAALETTVQSEGVLIGGEYGRLRLFGALQNGADGALSAWLGTARAELDLVGSDANTRGDSLGAGRELAVTAGLAFADDGTATEGEAFAVDGAVRWEGFGAFFEWVDLGRDVGDRTPFAAWITATLDPDVLELALRYEDVDDAADTTVLGAVLSRWVLPRLMKVQVGVERVRSDDSDEQGTRYLLGSVFSF